MIVIGVLVFFSGQFLVTYCCTATSRHSTDDLEWFRLEFKLSDVELANIRQLHEGYLPKCRDFCAKIDAKKTELKKLLSSNTEPSFIIEQKLIEIATLRARCQAAMIQHFREVSQVMPSAQGNRYLIEMQRLTLGFHEGIERSMSSTSASQHGHN